MTLPESTNPNVAPLRHRLASCLVDDAYSLYKLAKAGELDLNIEAIIQAREFLELIEKELGYGKKEIPMGQPKKHW